MSWSVQIARVFDIPIRLHITFLLLLGFFGFVGQRSGDLNFFWVAIGLFACVLLHELGHSVVAQRFGVRVLDITLLPIGGLARMSTLPKEPRQELLIAIAGPLVNFVLAPLFLGLHAALHPGEPIPWPMTAGGTLLGQLGMLNLVIGAFNLLPAFPMDGGRILRAILAQRMPYVRATAWAAGLGQLIAFGMAIYGLWKEQPMLIFIALFVFIGAAEEGARVQTQTLTENVPVRDAMMTRFFTLNRADNLGKAVDLLLAGTQHDFPVLEGPEMVGVLTRRRLFETLSQEGRDPYVSEVMEPAPAPVTPEMPLDEVLQRMAEEGLTMLPVHSGEGLVGLVTTDNTTEYVMVRAALLNSAQRQTA